MLFRLLWRRRTQPQNSQNSFFCQPSPNSVSKDGSGRRGRHCISDPGTCTGPKTDIGYFFKRCGGSRSSDISRVHFGHPSHHTACGTFQTVGSKSGTVTWPVHRAGRGKYSRHDAPFAWDESGKPCYLSPTVKALVATGGTVAAHITCSEERREKLLRRVGTVWEVVKNRVVTLGDPAGGQPLAKVIHESSKSSLQNLEASTSYSFNQPAGLPYKSTRPITQYFAGQWATTTNSLVDGSLRDVNLSTILSNVAQTVPSKESLGIQKHADREDSGMGLEEQPSVIEEVRSVVNSVPVQTSGTKEIPPATENHNSPVPGACTGTTRQSKPVEIVEGLDVIADVHDAQVSNYLGLCALKLEREHGQKKKQKKEMAVTPAVEFFESAAERDSASAAYNAGLCHEYAIGGVKRVDSVRAVVLYRQAAVAGHKAAQYNLGILLLRRAVAEIKGYSPAKDLREAAKWLNESALQDFLPAKRVLAIMNTYGLGSNLDATPKGPSTLQIEDDLIDALKDIFSISARGVCDAEDDQLTAYVTAAKGGSRLAAYNAGVICERRGDIGRAIHWYKMATNSADVDIQRDAHYNIGVLLRHTDAVDAIKHLKAASRLGDTEARACLKEMGQLHKL